MASRYEVEITITSAKDLKNVNWRNGRLKPYAVVWVDPNNKCSSLADGEGDTSPFWDQTLVVPCNSPVEDSTLYVDIVHAKAAEDTKPLIGSARLPLRDVVDAVGFGERTGRKLELKRPSGRPQGKVEVKVTVRQPRYRAPDPYYAPTYGVVSREPYSAPPPYGNPYAAPYQAAPPPSGYPYNAPPYGQGPQEAYVQGSYGEQKKKSKYGMGTGLAVGAAAGLLGGLAIAEGVDYVEDKIADKAAEKVEEDFAGGDDCGYDGYDD